MANNAVLSTVYNQYLTSYAPQKSNSRYDTHKRSELKNVYNSMVKLNRDAPLYKFDTSEESREYVIGLKEESRALRNGIVSVIGDGSRTQLGGRIAYSSDENIVSAIYVGSDDETGENVDERYDIEVKSMANPQVNLGKFLPKEERDIIPGPYAFDVVVGGQGYEFQYTIKEGESNFDIQNKLSRLINNANIKLTSSVEEDEEGNSALRIESAQLGSGAKQGESVFTISDSADRKVSGSVDYLGIDYVAREATDAELVINGQETKSASNVFLLNKKFEVSIRGISPESGATAMVGVKPDAEATAENISNLVGSYNEFIKTMSRYSSSGRNNGLMLEMNSIVRSYSEAMGRMGISVGEDGALDVNRDALEEKISDDFNPNELDALKDFSVSVLKKSNQISLNPVAYMNKTVVAYKNPGRNFSSPYTASAYSGFLFNSYC